MNNYYMLGNGPRLLPLHIVEYAGPLRHDCVLCAYSSKGEPRPSVKGALRIRDTDAHVRGQQHLGRVEQGGMLWGHVIEWGMNGTSFTVSAVEYLYRCEVCSLGKDAQPKAHKWTMTYHHAVEHVGSADHLRRCGPDDHRLEVHTAAGVPWAVPVVAAPNLVMAVHPPVVVAPVPVVVPAVPVVVPRQPQP
jgi:hypothetical protein